MGGSWDSSSGFFANLTGGGVVSFARGGSHFPRWHISKVVIITVHSQVARAGYGQCVVLQSVFFSWVFHFRSYFFFLSLKVSGFTLTKSTVPQLYRRHGLVSIPWENNLKKGLTIAAGQMHAIVEDQFVRTYWSRVDRYVRAACLAASW